jgi:hypothetical protein
MNDGETPREFAARLQDVCYALTRQAEAAIDRPASVAELEPS